MLDKGFHNVPPGAIATVVTHLEMREKPDLRPVTAPDGVSLSFVTAPSTDWYRDLYTRVGGHDWLWFSRLALPESELSAILSDPKVEVYAVDLDGHAEGLLELDFRQDSECELAFFGLTTRMIGRGLGRVMMNHAIEHAWRKPITRFHVHTCTLDHPSALGFYRRSGFTPIRQQIEIADDPRLAGLIPRHAGSHVPIIES